MWALTNLHRQVLLRRCSPGIRHRPFFPNPVRNGEGLNIEISQPTSEERMAFLFDLSGKEIKRQLLSGDQDVFEMPLAGLPAGVYLLQLGGMGERKVFVVP